MGEPQPICPWSFLGPLADSHPISAPAPKFSKPKTFASVLVNEDESHVPISQLAAPTIRGETVYVKINEEIYQEQLRACRNNLIGRLLLRKGTMPLKTETLKSSLNALWRPSGPWRLVPIGKGYFDLHFHSEADMRKIWGVEPAHLNQAYSDFLSGNLIFDPEMFSLKHTLRFGFESLLDAATKEQRFGYYARVLVDVDLLGALPTSIMVERENHCFPVRIDYENLPPQCAHCGLIGHAQKNCRQLDVNRFSANKAPEKHKGVRQEYRVKPTAIIPPVYSPS
ncbi:uncharacterized protein LOC112168770 [Rosa chinensis]|uniref:uncharacterized protein LOC112168770 n=1 Tax=Rosa chinensis TaxID=74649 RepID=UPI000D095CE3|nr:uncharacterized protein LOC112168770 [Rosa chinensis]